MLLFGSRVSCSEILIDGSFFSSKRALKTLGVSWRQCISVEMHACITLGA